MKPWKRERHVYQFDCTRCGKTDAQSLKKGRARKQLCRKCQRETPNPNQIALFGTPCEEGGIKHRDGCPHDQRVIEYQEALEKDMRDNPTL